MPRAVTLTRVIFLVALMAMVVSMLSVTVARAATTDVTVPSGQAVKFLNSVDIGANATPGFTYRYSNICATCSTAIDGIVTVVSTDGGNVVTLDYKYTNINNSAPISTEMSAPRTGGSISYQVSFVKAGTDDPVTMHDVYVNVTDIDSRQWAQFSGVQQYGLSSSPATKLQVQTNATNSAIPVGAYRFAETNGIASNDTDQDFWAQVKYNQASSILVTLAKGAGTAGTAVFGVSFNAAQWTTAPTLVNPPASTYTLSYDGNGSTGGSAPSSQTGGQTYTVATNSGPFTKPGYAFDGWNTQPDGNGVAYNPPGTSNDTITLTADTVLYAQWRPNFAQMQLSKVQTSADPTYPSAPTVTYELTVINTGNIPLTNVVITDPGGTSTSGTACTPITLNVGGTASCVFTKTATSTTAFTNTGQVSSDQIANVQSNTVTTNVNATHDLQVVKQQTSVTPAQAGDTVTFKVWVVNAGSALESSVSVADANATMGACSTSLPASLATGSLLTCDVSHVVTQAEIDAGVYTNTAQATSTYFTSPVNSNTVTVTFQHWVALDLQKSQASLAPSSVGDVITYNILATNIGNVDLTNLVVTDPGADAGSIVCSSSLPATLAPSEQLSCTATHTITNDDAKSKSFANTAYASSTQTVEQQSNTVTTNLDALVATGLRLSEMAAPAGFALIVLVAGGLLLLLRRRMKE